MAVNAAPGSSQPNAVPTMRRGALEETGRNSVSPCTSPRTTASNHPTSAQPLAEGADGGDAVAADTGGQDRPDRRRSRRATPRTGTLSARCPPAPVGWQLVEQRALGRSG